MFVFCRHSGRSKMLRWKFGQAKRLNSVLMNNYPGWSRIIRKANEPMMTLQWSHNGCDSVSNHQHHDCWLNRLFRRKSKKTSKLRVTGLCVRGIHRGPVNFTHTGPVTWKMFPFDDVIMAAAKWFPLPLVWCDPIILRWFIFRNICNTYIRVHPWRCYNEITRDYILWCSYLSSLVNNCNWIMKNCYHLPFSPKY